MLRYLLLAASLAALAAADEEAAMPQFASMPHRYKTVRPVAAFTDQLTTTVGLTLVDVDVDEAHNAATVSGWILMKWSNPALAWSEGAVNHTRVHPADIWTPDILPYQNILPAGDEWIRQVPALVYQSGQTLYIPPCTFKVRCQRQITADQDRFSCPFRLGSWTYSMAEMDVIPEKEEIDLSDMVDNGRWTVASSSVTRKEKVYDCCEEKYVSLDVELVLKPQHS